MSQSKTALLTGASNGIGLELAKLFAQHGYNLILVARDQDKLAKAQTELAAFGGRVDTHSADLSDYAAVANLKKWVDAQEYVLDALVLNAGQGLGGSFLTDTSLEKELSMIRLNVDSYVHLSKLLLPAMVARKTGRVLMTSSLSGTAPIPYEAVYGATKAFVNSFFYAIRNELKGSGVSMTLLMPGATETNFFKNSGQSKNTKVGSGQKDDPADVAQRAWYALMSEHEYVYGSEDTEFEGDVLNRLQSESQKAQRHRLISAPGTAQ